MTSVVIAEYVRSPYTLAYKGALKSVRADELAAQTVLGLIKKSGLPRRRAGL
jgi:acetyl-CoA acyltransferase